MGEGDEANAQALVDFFVQDYTEKGNGGDSDEEGEECMLHSVAAVNLINSRFNLEATVARLAESADLDADEDGIEGSPDGWQPPGAPIDWAGYIPKGVDENEPVTFKEVDNPGKWSDFTFRPKYKDGKYLGHFTPSGAQVVPENGEGKRIQGAYQFYYDGYTPDATDKANYVRGDATKEDLKPKSRKGSLDVEVLKKLGLDATRVERDPLFFLTCLLPICDPQRSGIEGDNRMLFFTHARACTNIYSVGAKGWGGGYGHDFKNAQEAELVNWMGVTIRHGAREGTPGSLHCRWDKGDPNYDEIIDGSITYSRFKQLKSVFKLNNNCTEPERGTDGYDPCSKYDHIYKAMCHNMNFVTKYADFDFGIDESTWGFSGYCGEVGGRLMNKPKDKGTYFHNHVFYGVLVTHY